VKTELKRLQQGGLGISGIGILEEGVASHQGSSTLFPAGLATHLAASSSTSDSALADHCAYSQIIFTYLQSGKVVNGSKPSTQDTVTTDT